MHPIPVWDLGGSRYTTPVTIKSAEIEGDRLKLTVEYAGTGKHHDVALLRDRSYKESSPPQLDLYLSHTTNDAGGQPVTEVLYYDLAPIKSDVQFHYKEARQLVLRIHDTAEDEIFVPLPRYSW